MVVIVFTVALGALVMMMLIQWRRFIHLEILLFGKYHAVVEVLIVFIHEQNMRLVCVITYKFSERRIIIS